MGKSLGAVLAAGCLAVACGRGGSPAVVLAPSVLDSMNTAFARSNKHWDELADLNTMERMLGTVRPTQREFLGCLQGEVRGHEVRVDRLVPARDMKQLQLAVAGTCDGVPRLVGTWHTHPFRADLHNLPIKERRLSAQDLETFGSSKLRVTLVMWDRDSLDAALRMPSGDLLVHPARVVVRYRAAG